MPSLTLPPDLTRVAEALHYYPDTRLARRFTQLVQRGTPWSPERPRALIRRAYRRSIAVDGERLLAVALAGFRGPRGIRWIVEAQLRLLLARIAIAKGWERPLAYADHDLLVLDGGGGGRPWYDGWSEPDPYGRHPSRRCRAPTGLQPKQRSGRRTPRRQQQRQPARRRARRP
jgi:hypothetical protein